MTAGDLHETIVKRFEDIDLGGAGGDRLVHNPKHAAETAVEKDRRFTLRPRRIYLLTSDQGGLSSCEYRIEYELVVNYNPTSAAHVPRMMNDAIPIINTIWGLTDIPGVTMVDDTNPDMADVQGGPALHTREFNVDFRPE
jgi:hypothetical protein